MPAKNVIKQYVEGGYYHIYNRGVEKRRIFENKQDYKVFLYYLKKYLTPPEIPPDKIVPIKKSDLSQEVKLLAFCLMPNHFHLLVYQKTRNAVEKLMRRIATRYVIYFNKKYDRVGRLFQNTYKAVLVKTDSQLLHLSRYIHLNHLSLKHASWQKSVSEENYSSYAAYLGKQKIEWLYPEEILSFFKTAQKTSLKDVLSYQSFVENYKKDSQVLLERIILE